MKNFFIMCGLLVASLVMGIDTPNEDSTLNRQLNTMEERKGEPLTVTDSLTAVVRQYGVTVDIAQDQIEKNKDVSRMVISKLDSTLKKLNDDTTN